MRFRVLGVGVLTYGSVPQMALSAVTDSISPCLSSVLRYSFDPAPLHFYKKDCILPVEVEGYI
jgi:hypothetical protein